MSANLGSNTNSNQRASVRDHGSLHHELNRLEQMRQRSSGEEAEVKEQAPADQDQQQQRYRLQAITPSPEQAQALGWTAQRRQQPQATQGQTQGFDAHPAADQQQGQTVTSFIQRVTHTALKAMLPAAAQARQDEEQSQSTQQRSAGKPSRSYNRLPALDSRQAQSVTAFLQRISYSAINAMLPGVVAPASSRSSPDGSAPTPTSSNSGTDIQTISQSGLMSREAQSTRLWVRHSDRSARRMLEVNNKGIYTIKYGDTLWLIAQRSFAKEGASPNTWDIQQRMGEIIALNLKAMPFLESDPQLLKPGMSLRIPMMYC